MWLLHLNACNGRALLRPPDMIIETDASRTGSFAVKSFTKDLLCVHMRLRMDNVSAVAYINHLGRHPFSGSLQLGPSSMAMVSKTQCISQCRASSGGTECVGLLTVFDSLLMEDSPLCPG